MTLQARIDGVVEGHDQIDMVGGRLEVVARIDAPNADVVVMRATVPPGGGVPLHSHADYECFHVVSGRLDVFMQRHGWTTVGVGQSAVVAEGERHAIRNASAAPVELLMIVNNRLARFFQEAGTPAIRGEAPKPPTPERFAHLVAVAGRYGYWLATPEEHAAIA